MEQNLSVDTIFKQAQLQQLAKDLAISPASVADICEAYQLTEAQLKAISQDKEFVEMFKAIQTRIQSDDTVAPQLKAREALLLAIPSLLALVQDKDTMNMDKINAVKALASIAGATQKDKAQVAGNVGVQVNLHLPGFPVQSIKPAEVINGE